MCYPDGVMDKFSEFAALAGHGDGEIYFEAHRRLLGGGGC